MNWRPSLGALPEPGGTRFRVWAPGARRVELVLETREAARPASAAGREGRATGAKAAVLALEPEGGGRHSCLVAGIGAGARYGYLLDGRGPWPDPASRFQPEGVHGLSEVVDPAAFAWSDAAWRGVPLERLVLYEVHVGTFTPGGTFAAAVTKLPHLVDLGITAIELMPLADFPGERNWGYDGAALFAPARCYGTPDDLRRLVDAAHAHGLGVHLDVVWNHLGPDGAYLAAFAPGYLARGRRTPWGAAVDLDGPDSAGPRGFLMENALHWVHEYHLDGLRVDATQALVDESPRHLLAEVASRVRGSVPERPVVVVAEDVRNEAGVVRPAGEGGWGLDAVWSFDFHHQAHRLLTGESAGFFGDFDARLGDLATILRHGWLYTGQRSRHRRELRGTDPAGIALRRFVFCLQNHDEVGNRPFGDRLHHLVTAATWRAAVTVLLFAPQTPLLFMGQEWAASTPFLFFTDHKPSVGARIEAGRRRAFEASGEFACETPLEGLPDPQLPEAFAASVLRWEERERGPHAGSLCLHRALLALRRRDPALAAGPGARFETDTAGPETLVLRRESAGSDTLVLVARLLGAGSARVATAGLEWLADLRGRTWDVELTTEDPAFAVEGVPPKIGGAGLPELRFARPAAVLFRVRG